VNAYAAKTNVSKLCDISVSGCDVIVVRHGQPWVRITALAEEFKKIRFGVMKGEITIAEDFDVAFADDLQRSFEGNTGT
jgi:antitoxin (DNA-binding transcriptional repressor) of toxin-antitoxin stability system